MKVLLFLIFILLNFVLVIFNAIFFVTEFNLNQALEQGFDRIEYILVNSEFDYEIIDSKVVLVLGDKKINLGSNFAVTEETNDLAQSLSFENLNKSGCEKSLLILDKDTEFEQELFQNSLIFFDYCLKL